MKKIFYLISASLLMLMAACQEIEMEEPGINFSPEKVVQVDLAAQEVPVTIEAGGDWTLTATEEYDWITPSVTSGKSGDKVTFTIALNTNAKIRAAVYEVKSDKLTEKLVIKQIGTKIDMSMELKVVDYGVDYATIQLDMNADDLDLFTKWGLRYYSHEFGAAIDPVTDGTDLVLEGAPAKGTQDIKIEGLAQYNYYTIWCWLENADGVRVYSDVTANVTAKELAINFSMEKLFTREFRATVNVPMQIEELGLCWGETENPDIEGAHIGQTGIISSSIDLKSIDTGILLKPETTYKIRPYLIKTNGDVFYGEETEFVTKKDPFVHWFKKEGAQSTWPFSYFNALSEYGPYHWGSKGHMNANPGTAQADITNTLNNACQSLFKTSFRYIYLLFNELEDGTPAMQLSIYAGNSDSVAKNRGSLIFLWTIDENGFHKFEYDGPASQTDAVNDLLKYAEDEIQYVIDYFNAHTFYFEFCSANIDDLTSQYSGIKMCEVDNPVAGVYEFNIMNTKNPAALTVHEVLKKNADGFYVIKTPEHWQQFSEVVSEKPGSSAILANDIDLGEVQTAIGSSSAYFSGTFDGQGHTITLNYSGGSTAPFRYTNGATIKNLHMAGVINTTGKYTASFIGDAYGATTIERCSSSVQIWQTSGSGWRDNAGFISNARGGIVIKDCLFCGSFKVDCSAYEYGGFIGWKYSGGTPTLTNCLFAPTSIEGSMVHSSSGTFCANSVNLNNCWYTQALGSAQGSEATADAYADGTLAETLNAGRTDGPWTVKDGKTVLSIF